MWDFIQEKMIPLLVVLTFILFIIWTTLFSAFGIKMLYNKLIKEDNTKIVEVTNEQNNTNETN